MVVPLTRNRCVGGEAFAGQATHGFRRQLGIGVGRGAGRRVDGVVTLADAIVTQHDAPGTRRPAGNQAEHVFDVVVADRRIGQKNRRAVDVNLAARVHIFVT